MTSRTDDLARSTTVGPPHPSPSFPERATVGPRTLAVEKLKELLNHPDPGITMQAAAILLRDA